MNAFQTTALAACTAAGAATVTLDGTRLTIEDAWAVAKARPTWRSLPKPCGFSKTLTRS